MRNTPKRSVVHIGKTPSHVIWETVYFGVMQCFYTFDYGNYSGTIESFEASLQAIFKSRNCSEVGTFSSNCENAPKEIVKGYKIEKHCRVGALRAFP